MTIPGKSRPNFLIADLVKSPSESERDQRDDCWRLSEARDTGFFADKKKFQIQSKIVIVLQCSNFLPGREGEGRTAFTAAL